MISKLLTGGKHGSDFKRFLDKTYPEVDCKISKSNEESEILIKEVEGIAGFNFLPPMDLSHIKWIHSFGAGVDSFLHHQLAQDIIITKTTGGMGERIAEYCLAYILNDLQRIQHFRHQQNDAKWEQTYLPKLSNSTVYIFGTGFIGQSVAKLLFPLVKKVIGINTEGTPKTYFTECISIPQAGSFHFEVQSIIINALPLTEKTRGLFNKSLIAAMQQSLLINVGRGASIKEFALTQGLLNGHIRHAVLDVFENEPLPKEHAFWNHKDITITPHISGITTLEDITMSFQKAYTSIKSNSEISQRINLKRAY